jgi:transposase-like protein
VVYDYDELELALVQNERCVGKNGEVSRFVSVEELFAGRHFDAEIVVCVRWYLKFQAELPGFGQHDERARHQVGAHDDSAMGAALHAGIREAVAAVRPPVGGSWRMDETYVKVRGEWVYLYRAVDKAYPSDQP